MLIDFLPSSVFVFFEMQQNADKFFFCFQKMFQDWFSLSLKELFPKKIDPERHDFSVWLLQNAS